MLPPNNIHELLVAQVAPFLLKRDYAALCLALRSPGIAALNKGRECSSLRSLSRQALSSRETKSEGFIDVARNVDTMPRGAFLLDDCHLHIPVPWRESDGTFVDGVEAAEMLRAAICGDQQRRCLESVHVHIRLPLAGLWELMDVIHVLIKSSASTLETLSVSAEVNAPHVQFGEANRLSPTMLYQANAESFPPSAPPPLKAEDRRALVLFKFPNVVLPNLSYVNLAVPIEFEIGSGNGHCILPKLEVLSWRFVRNDVMYSWCRGLSEPLNASGLLMNAQKDMLDRLLTLSCCSLTSLSLSGELSARQISGHFNAFRFMPKLVSLDLGWTCEEELQGLCKSLQPSTMSLSELLKVSQSVSSQNSGLFIDGLNPHEVRSRSRDASSKWFEQVNPFPRKTASVHTKNSEYLGSEYGAAIHRGLAAACEIREEYKEVLVNLAGLPEGGASKITLPPRLPSLIRLSFSGPIRMGLNDIHLEIYTLIHQPKSRGVKFQYGLFTATCASVIKFRKHYNEYPFFTFFRDPNTRLHHLYIKGLSQHPFRSRQSSEASRAHSLLQLTDEKLDQQGSLKSRRGFVAMSSTQRMNKRSSSEAVLQEWQQLLQYEYISPSTANRIRQRATQRRSLSRRLGGVALLLHMGRTDTTWPADEGIKPPNVGPGMTAFDLFLLEMWHLAPCCASDFGDFESAYDAWNRLSEEQRQVWSELLPVYISYRTDEASPLAFSAVKPWWQAAEETNKEL